MSENLKTLLWHLVTQWATELVKRLAQAVIDFAEKWFGCDDEADDER